MHVPSRGCRAWIPWIPNYHFNHAVLAFFAWSTPFWLRPSWPQPTFCVPWHSVAKRVGPKPPKTTPTAQPWLAIATHPQAVKPGILEMAAKSGCSEINITTTNMRTSLTYGQWRPALKQLKSCYFCHTCMPSKAGPIDNLETYIYIYCKVYSIFI